jgi:hypothetical protein
MNERIAGYHFDVQFGPMWPALNPVVAERAREVGVDVAPAGYALQPRALMLRVAGTHWTGLRSGEVKLEVLEYRSDLGGFLVSDPCVTSKELLASFGVAEERKGWTSNKLDKAVALWIRDGSLILPAFQDAQERVLAQLDVWRALDAMAHLASGEPSFGATLGPSGKGMSYASQTWAPDHAVVATTSGAKVSAMFQSKMASTAASVTLMERV